MSSLDALRTRKYNARGVVQNVGTDLPVALRLRYVGTGSVTSVTVTTGTNIVTVSTEGTKTYAFATYTTLATLAAKINADGVFEAKLLDALTTDATTSKLLDGAITAGADGFGTTVWDVLVDTSTTKALTTCLSYKRDFNTNKLAAQHRVHLQEIVYYATLGGAGAGLFNVYLRKAGTLTETLIFTDTSVSASKTSYTFSNGFGKISGREGDEIIVRLSDGTSIADAAANYLRITGELE